MAIRFSPEQTFRSPLKYSVGERVAVRQPHGVVLGEVEGWSIDGFHRNMVKVVVNLEGVPGSPRVIKARKIRSLD